MTDGGALEVGVASHLDLGSQVGDEQAGDLHGGSQVAGNRRIEQGEDYRTGVLSSNRCRRRNEPN